MVNSRTGEIYGGNHHSEIRIKSETCFWGMSVDA